MYHGLLRRYTVWHTVHWHNHHGNYVVMPAWYVSGWYIPRTMVLGGTSSATVLVGALYAPWHRHHGPVPCNVAMIPWYMAAVACTGVSYDCTAAVRALYCTSAPSTSYRWPCGLALAIRQTRLKQCPIVAMLRQYQQLVSTPFISRLKI